MLLRNYLIRYFFDLLSSFKKRFSCAKAHPLGIISRDILACSRIYRRVYRRARIAPTVTSRNFVISERAYFPTRGSPGLFNPINAHTTLICAVASPAVCVCVCVCLRFSLAPVALLLLLLDESLGFDVPASRE